MSGTEPNIELPPQVAFCERMMATWIEMTLAATEQCFRFWAVPFTMPLEHEHEGPGDLDVPGPLERDHEHNLFA